MPPSPYLSISSRGWASGLLGPRSRAVTAGLAGCNLRTPLPLVARAVDNRPDGVQQLYPEPGTGCKQRDDGVQPPRSLFSLAPRYRRSSRRSSAVVPITCRLALEATDSTSCWSSI